MSENDRDLRILTTLFEQRLDSAFGSERKADRIELGNNEGYYLEVDTIETRLENGRNIERRLIVTNINKLFGLPQEAFGQRRNFEVTDMIIENNKVVCLKIIALHPGSQSRYFYGPEIWVFPYGNATEVSDIDQHRQWYPAESDFYLKYCSERYYHYKGIWLVKIQGSCFG